jgi:hypothetical protein
MAGAAVSLSGDRDGMLALQISSFETRASRRPQDEVVGAVCSRSLILRRRRRRLLEGGGIDLRLWGFRLRLASG